MIAKLIHSLGAPYSADNFIPKVRFNNSAVALYLPLKEAANIAFVCFNVFPVHSVWESVFKETNNILSGSDVHSNVSVVKLLNEPIYSA